LTDAVHYFNISDVVVVPYRSATQSGIIQLAYSFSKPVIASDIDGLREMVSNKKTGLLFKKEDFKDLASQIICFYDEYSDINFQTNIHEFNKNYTWETFCTNLVAVLDN
jgi:glycosyltransferase involved in cell wall biosynthesis